MMECIYTENKDLSGAYLFYANLSGANLCDTNLSNAYLSNANLSGANLSGARVDCTDLSNANLSGANLSDANMGESDLSGANLSGANLTGANIMNAVLSGANLTGAIGISSKIEEMKEASRILHIIESGRGFLEMAKWHTCTYTHCIAGWCEPTEEFPGYKASLKLPSLARYFEETTNEEAIQALREVANGTLSVWNNQ